MDTNTHIHVDTKTHVATNTFMWLHIHVATHIQVATNTFMWHKDIFISIQTHIRVDTKTHSYGYKVSGFNLELRPAPLAHLFSE